jgi:hypothetical protein
VVDVVEASAAGVTEASTEKTSMVDIKIVVIRLKFFFDIARSSI